MALDGRRPFYNQHNPERAKQLLRESGYKGETIRFITTKEYAWMYNFALVTKQQLEELGLTIDLQVVDWATLVQRRNNPQMYDIFTTGMWFVPDPTQHPYLRCDWPGWTCDEEIQKRMDAIRSEPDARKRKALWDEVHKRFYEYVPVIRYGDVFGLPGDADDRQGVQRGHVLPALLQRLAGQVGLRRRDRRPQDTVASGCLAFVSVAFNGWATLDCPEAFDNHAVLELMKLLPGGVPGP